MKTSIYDNPIFFERYLKLRENPISLNEVVEKPTMFSLLPDLNGKKVLDLGCGAGGHLLHYMAMGAKQVVGLDLSQSMLEQAEKDFAKNSVDPTAYRFYCLPMEVLSPIAESDFDLVTSSFAFHYIKDLSALLTQISAKLKPQGQLIFSQEHPIVTCFKEGERDRNWFQQSFKTYHRTTATILNTLIQSNFTIEQVEEPMLADQVEWHNEFKDLQHRPPLLFIKSVKK
ncbi:class I SAM-dependent methyltransferase [Glaesserella parasuis]|uniref:class I SAM-dependent methyltransferase n=1 Tax=Glaesserella parasuis TaxID=738 RepID=UPI002436D95B|nr:class I SAM-dependent methyltransferase [Glaesserella parasuis]MDG6809279.1 class I SAM-dependent methyltransferase [Glaesserella parasuis]